MASSPLDLLAQDRILGPMVRNASLSQAVCGLMDAMLGVCGDHGWQPESLRFRDVTLNGAGVLRARFNRGRGGYSMFQTHADSIRSVAESGALEALDFLRRCRSFRVLMGTIYDRAIRFAHDGEVPFESMEFGLARIRDDGHLWMKFYRDDEKRICDERAGK